jgi:hypothetical protein
MTHLLDSGVPIDALNGRGGWPRLLAQFSERDILLACCAVNVTEIHLGMRPGEEARTEKFLRSLEFYPVTWEIARRGPRRQHKWPQMNTDKRR